MDSIYEKSRLFLRLTDNNNNNISDAKEQFDQLFQKKQFTKQQILDFLENYRNVEYNEKNIKKYEDLVMFFQYDIFNDFFDHIVFEYIIKQSRFLDQLKYNPTVCNKIKKICKCEDNDLCDKNLLYISDYVEIKELYASGYYCKITDEGIKHMHNCKMNK